MADTRTLTLQRISEAVCDRDRRIRITFADGYIGVVDLDPLIQKGGVFVALSAPEVRRRVEIGPGGRFLEWPGDIDLCADSLRLKAEQGESNEV
ncbi:hypothetical protein BH20GEM2_BH20GEM2_14200 [soil metagenome]